MKVAELTKLLATCDPNADVYVESAQIKLDDGVFQTDTDIRACRSLEKRRQLKIDHVRVPGGGEEERLIDYHHVVLQPFDNR